MTVEEIPGLLPFRPRVRKDGTEETEPPPPSVIPIDSANDPRIAAAEQLREALEVVLRGGDLADARKVVAAFASPGAEVDAQEIADEKAFREERARRNARRRADEEDAEQARQQGQATDRYVTGGSFVLDVPDRAPCLWGRDNDILWADGEALMIVGPTGVGKTTLVHQVVRARLGITDTAIGLPVEPTESRVLYLAMDRPPQIARAQRRLFGEEHRALLDDRLVVWKGPPPHDLAKRPETLLEMCQSVGADTVIVDSLKDACRKLSDDDTGSGYHNARSQALSSGVQVIELHHQRKASGENKKPDKIDDIYGSTWIPSGAGSVLLLWGTAGDVVVELSQIKQPAEQINPMKLLHDHGTGETAVISESDPLEMARRAPTGITPSDVAAAMFETETPTRNQAEKARRKLDKLVADGWLHKAPGASGGAGGGAASRYFAVARHAVEPGR